MAVITPSVPFWAAQPGISAPNVAQYIPQQNAAWREGDFLIMKTTGTITTPNPNGALATAAGPLLSNVTLGQSASAGVPALTYFGVVTYIGAAAIESQISSPFIFNTTAGNVPTVSVSSTGAPSGATQFAVYLGVTPTSYAKQGSSTNLGSTVTAAYPLTNSIGANRAAASSNSNILGMAVCDSDATFGAYPGGSLSTGKANLFGASQSFEPGWDNSSFRLPVIVPNQGLIAINLVQPWFTSLIGAAVGLNIDTSTSVLTGSNYFVADTTQTQIGTIKGKVAIPGGGTIGDTGARVLIQFLTSVLV